MTVAEGSEGSERKVSRIGPYTVLRVLGEGGMGRVYLTRSAGGRLVAVKTIRAELLRDPGFRERFRVEARAARQVSGAYTAPVIDADADAPVPWLATAYLDAPTLAEVVDGSGPLDAAEVRRLVAGLAEALGSVHAAGVVHRDLKPSNILMADDGPRLIDFGIAGALETAEDLRRGERPIGSAGYIAPERYAGRPAAPAADLFSLGAVLCFAATGAGPYGSGPPAVLDARVAALPPDLEAIRDPLLRVIAEYCLARDPAARPGTRDVLGLLAGRPFTPPPPEPSPESLAGSPSARRRPAVGSLTAAAVAVAAAVTAAALLWPSDGGAGAGAGAVARQGADAAAAGTDGFAWSLPASGQNALLGLWAGSEGVVAGSQNGGLADYGLSSGKRSWTWKPGSGDGLCAMSRQTSAGLGAVMYGPIDVDDTGITCNELQLISVATGRAVWSAPVSLSVSAAASPQPADARGLSIAGDLVTAPYFAAADEQSGAAAVADVSTASVATGKPEWSTDHGSAALADGCAVTDTAQLLGTDVYALAECDGGARADLVSISGAADSAISDLGTVGICDPAAADPGTGSGYLVTDADYLLIGCPGSGGGQSGQSGGEGEMWSLQQGSTKPVRLSLPNGASAFQGSGGAGNFSAPNNVLLDGDTAILATSSANPSELAFSLATGKLLWSHVFPGASALVPLVADGGDVESVAVTGTGATAHLVTLDAAHGEQTASQGLDSSATAVFAAFHGGDGLPYACAAGSTIAILFPQPLMADGLLLAALRQP